MTMRDVLFHGFTPRHESGDAAKLAYLGTVSFGRWAALPAALAERRVGLRAAHRRTLRRAGLPFRSVRRAS